MKNETSLMRSVFARRMYGLFIICALLPICALAVISLVRVSQTIRADSMDRLRHVSKNAGMTIVEGLFLLETELHSIAGSIHDGSATDRKLLRSDQVADEERRFLAFTIFPVNGTGSALLGKPLPRPPSSSAVRQHLANKKALLFRDNRTHKSERLFMAVALQPDLPEEGLLVAEINPTYLWTLVRHTLPPETELYVVDESGRPLFNSSAALPEFVSKSINKLHTSSVGQFEWKNQGQETLISYWSVFLDPLYHVDSWTVVASQGREAVFRPIRMFVRTFLLILFLTLIIVSYLSIILIRRNLIPLATLRKGANQLSQGDLNARVSFRSGDEFEELADTFNGMAEHLQQQFSTLRESGRIVQDLLSVHDREGIIRVALSAQDVAVPCDAMALSLIGPDIATVAVTYSHWKTDVGLGRQRETVTVFAEDDLLLLKRNAGYLHLCDGERFSSLLLTMIDKGVHDFYLLPFFLKGTLAGVLTVAYCSIPPHILEDLTRARQITDEIAVALDNIRLIDELNQMNWGTIRALANAVDAKSPWTAGHSERVTLLATEIGRAMGLTGQDLEQLHLAGMLHDIGKIAVPEAILDKPNKLTEEEYALIKTHPEVGARILKPISAYEQIIPMVDQHHEWFDGSGYPLGLSGSDICLGGRILAVADVFDALFSDRPYRGGWQQSRVLSFIGEKAGSQFDPDVVKILLAIMDNPSLGLAAAGREVSGLFSDGAVSVLGNVEMAGADV